MSKCSCCTYEQGSHKDFIRGGVNESDFEPDFRHVRLKKKSRKFCPKEKEQKPCQEFVKTTRWRFYIKDEDRYRESGYWSCIKCHRHKSYWYTY